MMTARTSFTLVLASFCAVSFHVFAPSGWAQSYVAEDLNQPDAIKAVGPNQTEQVGVRAGFTRSRSKRITQQAPAEDVGLLPTGDSTTIHGINDPGDMV